MSDIISYLTKIRFGSAAISDLQEELSLLGVSKPMLITDKGLVAAGLVDEVIDKAALPAGIPVFSETPENPTEEAVEAALELFRAEGADGIVALGGGSSIDLAKGVALLTTHKPPLEQYAAIYGGASKIGKDVAPLIAVPTTAGTGSEVGRATLLTLRNGRKLGFVSPHLIPDVAICDPSLTLSLPSGLTAATGMDAISHCIETYLSPKLNPVAEAIALDGLARGWKWLPVAFRDGDNLEARSEMMMAALQGALAFQKGLGAIHSMSHALGGMKEYRLHHGTLNAVLLPTVLRFNEPVCAEKFARMREVMGLGADTALDAAFANFNRTFDLPDSLSEMGVREESIEEAARWSEEDHSTPSNPRKATAADFAEMMRDAL
tara:strand:+ start:2529 stop:3662 length:1134 start_codon:yes stop_codon:yes gene_type:complete